MAVRVVVLAISTLAVNMLLAQYEGWKSYKCQGSTSGKHERATMMTIVSSIRLSDRCCSDSVLRASQIETKGSEVRFLKMTLDIRISYPTRVWPGWTCFRLRGLLYSASTLRWVCALRVMSAFGRIVKSPGVRHCMLGRIFMLHRRNWSPDFAYRAG